MNSILQSTRATALALAVALLALTAPTQGTSFRKVDLTCPLCTTAFSAQMVYMSTQWGTYLDLMPVLSLAAPAPLALCPKCRFVVFEERFDEATIERLRRYVDTPVYQAFARERSSYYALAKLLVVLRRSELKLGHTYLQASWQEVSEPARLQEDQELSLRHFDAYLRQRAEAGPAPAKDADAAEREVEAYRTAALVKGELLRRIGRFDEALAHFRQLQGNGDFQKASARPSLPSRSRCARRRTPTDTTRTRPFTAPNRPGGSASEAPAGGGGMPPAVGGCRTSAHSGVRALFSERQHSQLGWRSAESGTG